MLIVCLCLVAVCVLQVLQDCQEMMTDSALVTFIEGVVKEMSTAFVKILKGKRFTEWGGMKLRQQVKRSVKIRGADAELVVARPHATLLLIVSTPFTPLTSPLPT